MSSCPRCRPPAGLSRACFEWTFWACFEWTWKVCFGRTFWACFERTSQETSQEWRCTTCPKEDSQTPWWGYLGTVSRASSEWARPRCCRPPPLSASRLCVSESERVYCERARLRLTPHPCRWNHRCSPPPSARRRLRRRVFSLKEWIAFEACSSGGLIG